MEVKLLASNLNRISKVALPAALKFTLDILQIITDLIMVAKISVIHLSALGLSLFYINCLNIIGMTLVISVNYSISRYYSTKRYNRLYKTFYSFIIFSLFLSIISMLITASFSKDFLGFMSDYNSDIIKHGNNYLFYVIFMIPFLFLDSVIYSAFSAVGKTIYPLIIKIFTIFLNVFLNYILIYGKFGFPRLEEKGAALATLICLICTILIYIILIVSNKIDLRIIPKYSFNLIKKPIKIGLFGSFDSILVTSSYMFFMSIINRYGVEAIASFQVGQRLEGFAFMPGLGLSIAAMSFVSAYAGLKDYIKLKQDLYIILSLAILIMGSLGLFMIFLPISIIHIFTYNKDVIEYIYLYLFWVGITQVPLSILFIYSGALNGLGRTKEKMIISASSNWFLRSLPAFLFYYFGFSLHYIYVVMAIETIIRALIVYSLFNYYLRKDILLR